MSYSRLAKIPDDPPVIGRYRVYGEIAAGGMATVHFAKLTGAAGFSRVVALKRLHRHLATDPEFRSMLLDEARLSARVNHPNVVRTLDVLEDGDDVVIVMEYVLGESLSRAVRGTRTGERVPVAVAVAIVVDMLNGLHAAHEARDAGGTPLAIVHRDVSPQNVVVGADGRAHVIDFGIAKAASRLTSTSDGVTKGKQRYMAPEQLLGTSLSRQTDVYSAGVVLWELLTGASLFDGAEADGIIPRATSDVTRAPSATAAGVSPSLDAVTLRALARTQGARFSTARAMAEELAAAVRPATPEAVTAWLDDVAGDALELAREAVARIERHVPPAEASPPATSARALEGLARTTRRSPHDAATVVVAAPSAPRAWRAPASVVAVASVALVIAVAAFLVLGQRPARVGAVGALSAAPPPASAPSAPPEEPTPAAWETAPAMTKASDSPSAAAPPAAPPARAATVGAARPPAARATASAGTPPASRPCSPPFVFDAAGHKIYNPDCFH